MNRIAWLLRVNRLFGPEDRFATGSVFAQAFRGSRVDGVDAAQITRWERGTQRAGYVVIRRYEELLGLGSHSLVAVADMAYREIRGGCGRPILDRERGRDPAALRRDMYGLLDMALGGELMTGGAWDRLSFVNSRVKRWPSYQALTRRTECRLLKCCVNCSRTTALDRC